MGCNCRKAKKIQKTLIGDNTSENEGKFNLSWGGAKNYITRTLQGTIAFLIILLIFPFVLIYLYITYIMSGSFSLYLPKFISKRL